MVNFLKKKKELLCCIAVLFGMIFDHSFLAQAHPGYIYTGDFVTSRGDDRLEATNHQCLSMVIHLEARNQGRRGVELVGMVTLNRVMDSRWSDNVCDVISEYSQYEPIVPGMRAIINEIKEGNLFAFQEWVERNQNRIDREAYFINEHIAYNTMRMHGLDVDWLPILYFYNPHVLSSRGQRQPGWVSRVQLVEVYKDHHFLADRRS